MARTFCRSCSVSRSSRPCRSAQRACASRSAQPWQGCARRARRSAPSSGSSSGAPRPERPRRGDGGRDDAGVAQRRREVAAHRGHPVVDRARQAHAAQHRDGRREVGRGQPARPPVLGEHERARLVAAGVGVEDDGQPGAAAAGDGDHVARAQGAQRVGRRVALLGHPLAAQRLLPVADAAAQRGVLGEVAEVALHRRRVAGQGLGVALDPPGQPDHRAVGLELPERLLQQLAGRGHPETSDEVDGHVVAGPERAAQRVGARRREAADLLRVDPGLPDHDRVALDVDAAPPGAAGELGVLPRRQLGVRLAVELHQPFEHDGAGGHVDAQRQGLGGEHGADQPADEQLLDGLLERRQHPGVVRGEPALQGLAPLPVAEHAEVGLRQVTRAPLDDPADLDDLVLGREPQPGPHALARPRRRSRRG